MYHFMTYVYINFLFYFQLNILFNSLTHVCLFFFFLFFSFSSDSYSSWLRWSLRMQFMIIVGTPRNMEALFHLLSDLHGEVWPVSIYLILPSQYQHQLQSQLLFTNDQLLWTQVVRRINITEFQFMHIFEICLSISV